MRRLWKKYTKPYVLVGLLLVMSIGFLVQCAGVLKILGLDEILQSEPPITTSLSDAVTEVPFLDDYDLDGAIPMSTLPRTPDGGFVLEHPGHFIFEAKSYCLGPGKYSPSGKYGYLYAPLKGPWADIVRNILQRSVNHPEIPQRDIQVLLWAIISRTKISDMSAEMQQTATKLLTPEEIFKINGGALGLIPEELLQKAIDKLPPQVRQVMEAEARLREMLTEARATYEELERVAVRFGSHPRGEGSREVPRGRWSYHPDGLFIRYFPDGYTRMLIELSVPEPFQIERDQQGRITLIADDDGNRIETDYDDAIKPSSILGEPSLKAYAFRSIRFKGLDPNNPGEKLRTEWSKVGWTFLGVPAREGRIGTFSDRFSGLKERYEWAKTHKKELNNLEDGVKKLLGRAASPGISQRGMEEIMALGHYAIALKEAIGSSGLERKDWVLGHVNLVKKAWQTAVSRYMGTYKTEYVFNPAGDPASGDTEEQFLVASGSTKPKKPNWLDQDTWDQLNDCQKRCVEKCEKYRPPRSPGTTWEKCIDDCYATCEPIARLEKKSILALSMLR